MSIITIYAIYKTEISVLRMISFIYQTFSLSFRPLSQVFKTSFMKQMWSPRFILISKMNTQIGLICRFYKITNFFSSFLHNVPATFATNLNFRQNFTIECNKLYTNLLRPFQTKYYLLTGQWQLELIWSVFNHIQNLVNSHPVLTFWSSKITWSNG